MSKRLTKEDMSEWLLQGGSGITLVGEYVTNKIPTLFQCCHGHRWTARPDVIKNGRGCPECADTQRFVKQAHTSSDMDKWLMIDGRGIILVEGYINNSTKTVFQCRHGHQWSAKPNDIKNGQGCPECADAQWRFTAEKLSEWLLQDGREITLVGEFESTKIKTTFQCHHGHQWASTPSNIKQGRGCPVCAAYGFNPNKAAWEYAFTRDGYLKFGITNDIVRRLNEHRRHGEFTIVHERYHEVGQVALDWENNIKRTYGGKFVTKDECPHGYTETLPIHLLEELIK